MKSKKSKKSDYYGDDEEVDEFINEEEVDELIDEEELIEEKKNKEEIWGKPKIEFRYVLCLRESKDSDCFKWIKEGNDLKELTEEALKVCKSSGREVLINDREMAKDAFRLKPEEKIPEINEIKNVEIAKNKKPRKITTVKRKL